MSQSGQIRTRSERVAALDLPPGPWERAWLNLRRRDILGRIGLAFFAALVICFIIQGWNPPFDYRVGDAPRHSIVARVPFTRVDDFETKQAKIRAADQARYVYTHDVEPLRQLRSLLRNTINDMVTAETLKKWDATPSLEKWKEFQPIETLDQSAKAEKKNESPEQKPEKSAEEQFQEFKANFTGPEKIKELDLALEKAFKPYEQDGLLVNLSSRDKTGKPLDKQKPDLPLERQRQGNQDEILVHPVGQTDSQIVKVVNVQMGDGTALKERLRMQLKNSDAADRIFAWLRPRLMPTLKLDQKETDKSIKLAQDNTPVATISYAVGDVLAKAGMPLTKEQIALLRLEYYRMLEDRRNTAPMSLLIRGSAMMGMIFVAFLLCGVYTRYRQRTPAGLGRAFVLTLMSLATVALAQWAAADNWHAEILPIVLFGMTLAVITRRELALLITGILSAIVVLALGEDLSELVVLLGTATTAILGLGSIRSRSKLIYVGLLSGAVAVMLNLTMETISDQPMGWILLNNSLITGLWTVAAGFVMTGLLPFIEQAFGVLTDLSLLELGDVAHPLLQELVRRAPSTYNHSVTVGSIAEAAAESIGARGLLCRVGSYFHDIGKMLKPGYFIENQSATEGSRHESLMPAMSTLVIIAHIKDGSDLARQHHLPQPIVDLIAQHHGTTLVEYFFGRAQRESDPNNGEVDESSFRYPGPKPQTKEAAVLMMADAVESASRTLVDPTPARIESLVREIAERRLDDGQFDESGLTLRELRTIERSLAMSVASIYHGRIKYPDQKTA